MSEDHGPRLAAKQVLMVAEASGAATCTLAVSDLRALLEEVNTYRAENVEALMAVNRYRANLTKAEFGQLDGQRSPTHRCRVCGAYWIQYSDSWSLCSKRCGKCCDNEKIAEGQLVALSHSDLLAPVDSAPDEEPSVEWRSLGQLRAELKAKVESHGAVTLIGRMMPEHFMMLLLFVTGNGPMPPELAEALGLEMQYGKATRAGWL